RRPDDDDDLGDCAGDHGRGKESCRDQQSQTQQTGDQRCRESFQAIRKPPRTSKEYCRTVTATIPIPSYPPLFTSSRCSQAPMRGPHQYHRAVVNRLAGETSPYLLQHAHNPVDWFPWGPDALARAKLLDRPIFLSIGYAACHWCHVMERESFEHEPTARYLNDHFVAVKVDREERPDLDQVYMAAVQSMTGGGGWPMSVFLTPAGRPFYGGTYFPDEPRHGMPSFGQVLEGVDRAWRQERGQVEAAGVRLVEGLIEQGRLQASTDDPSEPLLEAATTAIEASFDPVNGGWGRAPKFPQPMTIEFLLRRHVATGG